MFCSDQNSGLSRLVTNANEHVIYSLSPFPSPALARQQRQSKRSSVVSQGVVGSPKGSPKGSGRRQTPWSPKSSKDRERKGHRKLHVTSSVTFKEPEEEEEEEEEEGVMSNPMSPLPRKSKVKRHHCSTLSNLHITLCAHVRLHMLLSCSPL